jgi:O-antigen/teichoic acid export membrane protein
VELRAAARDRRDSVIASGSILLNGLMNAVVLALSARQGRTDEIAAYSVVMSVLTLVPVLVAGGSTLLYATGDERERHAVRSQRVFIVLPSLIAGAAVVALVYTGRGYTLSAVLAVSVAVLFNNIGELQLGDLTRQLRFMASAAGVCGSKVCAVVLVAADVSLTKAVAYAAIAQFIGFELALGNSSWLRRRALAGLSWRAGVSAFRMNRQLFVLTLADLHVGRIASIVLSLIASTRVMGCLGTVAGAFQALLGVSQAALKVPMANRTRQRHGLDEAWPQPGQAPNRDIESGAVVGSIVVAAGLVVMSHWITDTLLRLPIPESADWLCVFAVALPFATLNRAFLQNLLGSGNYRMANRLMCLIAVVLTVVLVPTVPLLGVLGAPVSTLAAEAALAVGALVVWTRAGRSTVRSASS